MTKFKLKGNERHFGSFNLYTCKDIIENVLDLWLSLRMLSVTTEAVSKPSQLCGSKWITITNVLQQTPALFLYAYWKSKLSTSFCYYTSHSLIQLKMPFQESMLITASWTLSNTKTQECVVCVINSSLDLLLLH